MIRKQSHDGSLATVRAICFRVHHGCIILRTIFCNAVSFAHLTTFLIRTQFDAFTIYSSIPTVSTICFRIHHGYAVLRSLRGIRSFAHAQIYRLS